MDGWMDGRTDGRTDRQTDNKIDRQIMSLLGYAKKAVKSWEAAPEELSLEATAKDSQ